jgi:hypothetical protein
MKRQMNHPDELPQWDMVRRVLLTALPDGGTRFSVIGEKAGRHFNRTGVVIWPETTVAIRQKYGTSFDGTAALNK